MLGYRRRAFEKAHSILRAIEADQSDFSAIFELQVLLIEEIMLVEQRIRDIKAQAAHASSQRKNRARNRRLEGLREELFIWRSFGDGIAFSYINKHALKHTFYKTDRYHEKQQAGFLSGKDGLRTEIQVLSSALEHGVPAVLTDLTNTIRHGDICLLGASDPELIEVKASSAGGRRSRRQGTSLKALKDFLEADRAVVFRGVPNVMRVEAASKEVDYAERLNACMSQALSEGFACCQPEEGLQYIVARTRDADLQRIIDTVTVDEPWLFSLNDARAARRWAPYSPFTLMIQAFDNLWAFVRGDLYVLIVVSISYLEGVPKELGFEASFDREDELYPLGVDLGEKGVTRISKDYLARSFFECASPRSLIARSLEMFITATGDLPGDEGELIEATFSDPLMAELAAKYAEEAGFDGLVVPTGKKA